MTADLKSASLLVVNYRSAPLTARAIETARTATSRPLQVVVVDNSCDPAEAQALRSLSCDSLMISEENLGYGRAINRAMERCTGEIVVIANPDVEFHGDAVDALIERIDGRAVLAGPRFVWDDAGEWLLPPADVPGTLHKSGEILAARSSVIRTLRDRRLRHQRAAFWSLRGDTAVRSLSGAVLAIRSQILKRFRFDERFQLYFEEADLMRRLRREGLRVLYAPSAVCRHLFAQSSAGEMSSDALYSASESLFLEKWSSPRLLAAISALPAREAPTSGFVAIEEPVIRLTEGSRSIIEASPLPDFRTAAGHFPRSAEVRIPAEILATYRYRRLYLREVELDSGRILQSWLFSKCD